MSTAPPSWDASDDQLFLRHGDVFVPRRTEQIDTISTLVAPFADSGVPRPLDVLDLGCGEGRLSAAVLRRHPDAHVTGVDGSDTMLAAAAERLAPFGDRARLVKAALEDSSWRHGSYAAIVSSLAVHHLDDDGKRQLYQDLHTMLRPGGQLVLADLVRPATPSTTRWTACRWDHEVDRQAALPPGNPAAARAFRTSRWNTFRYPDPVDKPATVVENLRWLDEAGFDGTDLCWAFAGHVVITATGRHRTGGAR